MRRWGCPWRASRPTSTPSDTAHSHTGNTHTNTHAPHPRTHTHTLHPRTHESQASEAKRGALPPTNHRTSCEPLSRVASVCVCLCVLQWRWHWSGACGNAVPGPGQHPQGLALPTRPQAHRTISHATQAKPLAHRRPSSQVPRVKAGRGYSGPWVDQEVGWQLSRGDASSDTSPDVGRERLEGMWRLRTVLGAG